jgi:hypothetical protein
MGPWFTQSRKGGQGRKENQDLGVAALCAVAPWRGLFWIASRQNARHGLRVSLPLTTQSKLKPILYVWQ